MSETVQSLVREALVWDAHAGFAPEVDIDFAILEPWREAGVDHVSLNVGYDAMPWNESLRAARDYHDRLTDTPGVRLVSTVDDVLAARTAGELAVSLDLEGACALNGDLGLVEEYHRLGVRQMLFAYNRNNEMGGGCHDDDSGITALGREAVVEMNRLGMVVDASHCGKRTALDLMESSSTPVVFSHSNARAVRSHGRNIDDDLIRACAEQDGVIGLCGIGIFLGDNDDRPGTMADHACHIADLVGTRHVALGIDWAPPTPSMPDLSAFVATRPDFWPAGHGYEVEDLRIMRPERIADLCDVLSVRGWTREDLIGLLGGNFLRVARAAWPEPDHRG
jgi:membrane dipeptidase